MDISKFKALRKSNGLTQWDLAQMLGVSQTTVAMWETGANNPTAEKLPVLAEILGCTIDDLFGRESEV